MIAFWGLAIVLALGTAPVIGAHPFVSKPGLATRTVAQQQAIEPPEPVTLIALTDGAGARTDVAVDGLRELQAVAEGGQSAAGAGAPGIEEPEPPTAAVEPGAGTLPSPGDGADEEPASGEELAEEQMLSDDELAEVAVLTPPIPTQEFLVAGVTWDDGAELPVGAEIFLRVYEAQEWSEWLALEPDGARAAEEGAGRPGTDPFVTGGAEAVQIQVTGDAAALPPGLDLSLIPANPEPPTETLTQAPAEPAPQPTEDPIVPPEAHADEGAEVAQSDLGRLADELDQGVAPGAGQRAEARFELAAFPGEKPVSPAPSITSRAGWGADESLMTWEPTYAPLRAAVVHHTAGTNSYTSQQSPSVVRGIYHFHAVTRDWGDIGYNYLVDRYGRIFEGRSGTLQSGDGTMPQAAHARGYNYGSLGISAMGDFTRASAPEVILERMADVIAWRFSLAEVDPDTPSGFISPSGATYRNEGEDLPRIFGHGEVAPTTCPSPDILSRLDSLRAGVERRLAAARTAFHSPFGAFDGARGVPGGIEVRGWAVDPDTTNAVYVWVTVDGVGRHVLADKLRPDITEADPDYGPEHGFQEVLAAGPGEHRVCVTAANVGEGAHAHFSCGTARVPGGPPFGSLDEVRAVPGGIELRGWAIDPDTASPAYVWVTIDGAGRYLLADKARSDVGRVFPDYGSEHGYEGMIRTAPGTRRVCVTASNLGTGGHTGLGCRDVAVLAGSPFGNFEQVSAVPGGLRIRGWAIDPDTRAPIFMWVTVDGLGRHVYADGRRDDVGRAYPAYGATHGFDHVASADPGPHQVCVTASNVLAGSHTGLACHSVTVR